MKLVKNEEKYWDFIRLLRIHPDNAPGFVVKVDITKEQQVDYMAMHNDDYYICLGESGEPVGYIGVVDNDIRLAVEPTKHGLGIGKYMLVELVKISRNYKSKVFHSNKASLRLFLSCGFKEEKRDDKFVYFSLP